MAGSAEGGLRLIGGARQVERIDAAALARAAVAISLSENSIAIDLRGKHRIVSCDIDALMTNNCYPSSSATKALDATWE